jgi:cell division protein ZapB
MGEDMSSELFDKLEGRILSLLDAMNELKLENGRLRQENDRLSEERGGFKARIDAILKRLEGV